MSRSIALPLALSVALCACGGGSQAAPAPPVSTPAPTPTPPPPPQADFGAVEAALQAAPFGDTRILLGDDEGVFWQIEKGSFGIDEQVPIASASKLLTGIVFARLIAKGEIALTDRPQDYLDFWTSDPNDPRSRITLEMLLSFTSGLYADSDADCMSDNFTTLEACAAQIYDIGLDHEPGAAFAYIGHHMQVAGAMVEAATGEPWRDLVARELTDPLGLDDTTFGGPFVTNPRLPGGALSTASDYAEVLTALMDGSLVQDLDFLIMPRTVGLPVHAAPPLAVELGDWTYALGNWRECDGNDYAIDCSGEQTFSSAGAFGWVPWVDLDAGYWGIIAREGFFGASQESTRLEQEIQPLIEAAL